MKVNKKMLIFLILGIIAIVGGLYSFYNLNKGSVKTPPKRGPIVEAIFGIGTVTPRNHFAFRLGISSSVTKSYVNEGDSVNKNQPLLQLEHGLLIKSPFSGTITSLVPSEGENIFPDQVIITVEDLTDVYVLATIDQQSALRVQKGMPVRLSFETIRNQKFNGKVKSIYPFKGQFIAHIETEQLPQTILPGMTSDVSIEVSKKDSVVLIPILSVQQGKILLERNGKRQKLDVKIGATDSEWAEVLEPELYENDLIILRK